MFLDEVAEKCHANLLTTSAKLPLAYLVSRGITFEEIKKYKIGYIGKVFHNIVPKGSEKEEIENFNKWLGKNGRFVSHRIVFPILDELGNIRGIETRGLDQRAMKILKPAYKTKFSSLIKALAESNYAPILNKIQNEIYNYYAKELTNRLRSATRSNIKVNADMYGGLLEGLHIGSFKNITAEAKKRTKEED